MSQPTGTLPQNAIAIVGMAGRFPGARSAAELWQLIRDGREAIQPLSDADLRAAGVPASDLAAPNYVKAAAILDDMESFDAGFFGFSPRDAAIMDPQHRHFLECAWEALEAAGHVPESFDGPIGIFGGCGMQAYFARHLLPNHALMASVGTFLVRHTGNDKDFLTTRVSYQLNLRGPASACRRRAPRRSSQSTSRPRACSAASATWPWPAASRSNCRTGRATSTKTARFFRPMDIAARSMRPRRARSSAAARGSSSCVA